MFSFKCGNAKKKYFTFYGNRLWLNLFIYFLQVRESKKSTLRVFISYSFVTHECEVQPVFGTM